MKTKFTIYFFLIYIYSSYSQFKTDLTPTINFHSSNSTSLGAFGDVPVSLYTGTPNISIPIHKLNERGVELDVNLQYDARGVRVNDVPGWVGQNWVLNAGGVITRTVRGTAYDELNFFHNKNVVLDPFYVEWSVTPSGLLGGGNYIGQIYRDVYQRGYFYHADKLNVGNWNAPEYLTNLANISSYTYFDMNFATRSQQNYNMDLVPDLFTFNFMGHSGHFFLGHDGQWKVFSNSNLKVLCNMDTDIAYPTPLFPASDVTGTGSNPWMVRFPKVINKITLVDDKGVIYIFDQVELTFNNILSQRPPYNNDSRCISSAFYLTKVKDSNNCLLYNLEYDKGPWQGKFSMSYHSNRFTNNYSVTSNTAIASFTPNWPWHQAGFGAPGQLILPSYLKKITTESGIELQFNSTLVQNALKYTRGGNTLIDDRDESYYGMDPGNYIDLYFLFKEPDLITDSSDTPYYFNTIWNRLKNKKLTNINIKDNSNNEINVDLGFIDSSGVRLFLDSVTFNNSKKYKLDYSNYFLPGFLDMKIDHLGYYNNVPFKLSIDQEDENYWSNELMVYRATHPDYVKYGSLRKITYPTGGYTEFEFEPHKYSKKLNEDNQFVTSNGIIGGLRIKKIINNFNNNIETIEYLYQKSISNSTLSGNLLYCPTYMKNSGIIDQPSSLLQLSVTGGKSFYSRSLNSIISMSNFMGVYLEYTDVIEKKSGNGFTHYKFSNYEEFPDIDPVMLNNKAKIFTQKTDRSFERGFIKEKYVYNQSNILKEKSVYNYYAQNSLLVNCISTTFSYYADGFSSARFWLLPFSSAYQIPYTDKYVTEENIYRYNDNGSLINTYTQSVYKRFPDVAGTIANNGSIFKKKEYILTSESNYGKVKTFSYPFEFTDFNSTIMTNSNKLPVINEKVQVISGDIYNPDSEENITESKMVYETLYNDDDDSYTFYHMFPKESFNKKGEANFEKEFVYTKYDKKGNILEYKKDNGTIVSVIWGYKQTKPIAILENVAHQNISQTTIDDLLSLSNLDIDSGVNGATETILRNALNALRVTFPNAMIKTSTYDPLSGITSITDSAGDVVFYEYDDLLRLERIKDKTGSILKEYQYNYKPSYNPED